MIKGPAGSGKTLMALGFLFNQLEKNRIDDEYINDLNNYKLLT